MSTEVDAMRDVVSPSLSVARVVSWARLCHSAAESRCVYEVQRATGRACYVPFISRYGLCLFMVSRKMPARQAPRRDMR